MTTFAKARRATLALEHLEDRCTPTVSLINGSIYILGTNYNDLVTVDYHQDNGQTYYKVSQNGSHSYFNVAAVPGFVWFSGGDGNDFFDNSTYLNAIAYGGDGADSLFGGAGNDYLHGGYGPDLLAGGDGNDYLDAGAGDYAVNVLHGNAGHDTLQGSEGNDVLLGHSGVDFLYGHGGNDNLDGGNDNTPDFLFGGAGNDAFWVEATFYNGVFNYVDTPGDFGGGDSLHIMF
jgi:Ca2+-binding RTX toxin-like protein